MIAANNILIQQESELRELLSVEETPESSTLASVIFHNRNRVKEIEKEINDFYGSTS